MVRRSFRGGARCALLRVVGSWILSLILAASGVEPSLQEARGTLGVTATVTESCLVGGGTSGSISCTAGTHWTRSTAAAPALSPARATRRVDRDTRYITITY